MNVESGWLYIYIQDYYLENLNSVLLMMQWVEVLANMSLELKLNIVLFNSNRKDWT